MAGVNHLLKVIKRSLGYFLWLLLDPSKFKKIRSSEIKKILVINLGFIGDLLATTPVIAALKKKFKARLSVLVRKEMLGIFNSDPNTDQIITYSNNFKEDLRRLKKENFDLAIIVWPASFRLSWLCLRAGIPYRIGTTQTGLLEEEGWFLTRKVRPSFEEKHKIQENLDISRLIGVSIDYPKIEFYFLKEDNQFVTNVLKKNKIKDFIVLHPGKRGRFYAEYSWPLKNFAAIIDYLVENYKASIVITGAKGEEQIAKEIVKSVRYKNQVTIASGKLNLGQFGALLKKSKLLISIDTAPVHIASAFETPIIVLNAKYPRIWYPYMSKEKYVLLNHPKIEQVKQSIQILLKR